MNDIQENAPILPRYLCGRQNRNPRLESMESDHLYHLGIAASKLELKKKFGDVKFVCMGGTEHRMEEFAHRMVEELKHMLPRDYILSNYAERSHRCCLYKVGPILCVSHGMGVPSLTIILHELMKLLWHAGVEDATFIRIGTSGGIDVDPGTIVVTSGALDCHLRATHETVILGKTVHRQAKLDQELVSELVHLGAELQLVTVSGKTFCANDFYEGQARLDGAFCHYGAEDKRQYLLRLKAEGIINIEMEATSFAALTYSAGFRAAIVCVTLVDRLQEDQVTQSKETYLEWQSRPQKLVAGFITKSLFKS